MSSFKQLTLPSKSGGLWSIERVVALFTPLFSAGAGIVVSLAGKLVPGVTLNKTDITALFITGATAAAAASLKWLHGRQKFVSSVTDVEGVVQKAVERIQELGGQPIVNVENALKSHEDNIIKALGDKLGAPPSAEQIAEQIVQRMLSGAQGPVPAPAAAGQAPAGQTS